MGWRRVPNALHTMRPPRFSFVLRLTMSHVVLSCVGVKHISGASGANPGWSAVPRLCTRISGQRRLARVSQGVRWSMPTKQCIETRCKVL